jgi:hypothetical protein
MRMIRQKMTELSKNLFSLTRPSLRGGGYRDLFSKTIFFSELFKTCFSGVIRGEEFESEVSFPRKPVGWLRNKTNCCWEIKVHLTRLSQGNSLDCSQGLDPENDCLFVRTVKALSGSPRSLLLVMLVFNQMVVF